MPISEQKLLQDADDAYYATEYDKAIELYTQFLDFESDNEHARKQLEKAELYRVQIKPKSKIPREAVKFYRRARSYLTAKDFHLALDYLNAAVESAQEGGVVYSAAEQLLDIVEETIVADEIKQRANLAIANKQWDEALALINKAHALTLADIGIQKELDILEKRVKWFRLRPTVVVIVTLLVIGVVLLYLIIF